MDRGADRGGDGGRATASVCVVPADLAGRLAAALRDHFEDTDTEVVVERRRAERRSGTERRQADCPEHVPPSGDRRHVRNADGRRIADRRAPLVEVPAPRDLPRRARRQAERLTFAERLEPSPQQLEDTDTARLVIAFQSGDREAFPTLYRRYFDRVFGYVRLVLRETHEAEDLTQEVFLRALGALPRYEHRSRPFRAWLFTIARNLVLPTITERERVEPTEDAHELLAATAARDQVPQDVLPIAPGWLSDGTLSILIERLPESQRQALFLRYALGLPAEEVGTVMGRSAKAVRQLQSRGLQKLRERLIAVGRDTKRGKSGLARVRIRGVGVLGARRFALGAGGLSYANSRQQTLSRR